jgi:uncharacterized membrane protein
VLFWIRRILLVLAALAYIFAGYAHFTNTPAYLKIMPPYLPWHLELVYLSGVAEIVGGVGLLIPALRRYAAWWLVALLVAVFPANVHMALNQIPLGAQPLPQWVLWVRLPVQAVLIWWVLWCTRPGQPTSTARDAAL